MSISNSSLPKVRPIRVAHKASADSLGSDVLYVIVDESEIKDAKITSQNLQALDAQFGGVVSSLIALGDFEGKWLQSSTTLATEKAVSKRVVLVGAGKKNDYLPARVRQLGIKIGEEAPKLKANKAAVTATSSLLQSASQWGQLAIGFSLGVYKYPNTNLSAAAKAELETPIELTVVSKDGAVSAALEEASQVSEAIQTCRLLQDGPPNVCTPKYVAQIMGEKAAALGLNVQVWGAQKLKEVGFNAMMAVGGGSVNEPQFVVIEYKPANYTKTLALVGKGLTMDTGGYSLKPPDSQVGMKYDMSGAAVTLNSVLAIAALKLPIRVFGIAALCENMVDAHAYRVGDVLKTYSGKTIEIMNTDAEGRVVLSDALSYTAKELKPDYIVEYSTLTGAMVIALGQVGAGVFTFSNTELEKKITAASERSGERTWPMPSWEEVGEAIKGTIADVNNIGTPPRSAGSIVAAMFLKEFVENVPYAHIDIAGVANDNLAIGYPRKISSGYGVQLNIEIARQLANP